MLTDRAAMTGALPPLDGDEAALDARKAKARAWFETLRDQICAAFEQLEDELPAGLPRPSIWHPDAQTRAYRRYVDDIRRRMERIALPVKQLE